MRRITAALAGLGLAAGVALGSAIGAAPAVRRTAPSRVPAPARGAATAALDTLAAHLGAARAALERSPDAARREYRAARLAYKRVEFLVEYYSPSAAATLNGRRRETDNEDLALPPAGATNTEERAEASIFDRDSLDAGLAALDTMCATAGRVRRLFAVVRLTDAQVLDAARLELARIEALGLAGFDTPETPDLGLESAAALDGLRSSLVPASDDNPTPSRVHAAARFDSTLVRAAAYLRRFPDAARLDRLTALVGYLDPAAHALGALREAVPAPTLVGTRAWSFRSASVFDPDAFDPMVYASADGRRPTPALVALGRALFSDPRLSGDGTRSCAFCHQPSRAFTDGRRRALPLPSAPHAYTRNTPTLIDAAYQPAQFADGRAASLEDQVVTVLASPAEMASSIDTAVARLRASASYRAQFSRAFGVDTSRAVTTHTVRAALAAYVRSLSAFDSPFDRALAGDSAAFSPAQRRGFDVFMGKARCGTCHFIPLLNGTVPPGYVNTDPEIIGVPRSAATHGAVLDSDPGAGAIDHLARDTHAFKVPTLRNIALTAPYMHNGVFTTLDQVIAFYDRGGGRGSGARVPHQTLDDRPLHLTPRERADLRAFLESLTDTVTTPRWSTTATPPAGRPLPSLRR